MYTVYLVNNSPNIIKYKNSDVERITLSAYSCTIVCAINHQSLIVDKIILS